MPKTTFDDVIKTAAVAPLCSLSFVSFVSPHLEKQLFNSEKHK